jgi:hypothetical protein
MTGIAGHGGLMVHDNILMLRDQSTYVQRRLQMLMTAIAIEPIPRLGRLR